MSNQNEVRLSERLAVFQINFRQWTGATIFQKEDFRLGDGGQLPPDQVVHDIGTKRIVDPATLRIFGAIKQRATRLLIEHGVPFMGGMAIPLEKCQLVCDQLDNLVNEYHQARDNFVNEYDKNVQNWLDANPDYSEEIRRSLKSKTDVGMRIWARYDVFKVSPLGDDEGFSESEKSLGATLIEEVSKQAKVVLKESFGGQRNEAGERVLSPIRKIRDRLNGLSFLDGNIYPIIAMIDSMLASLPPKGPYSGESLYKITNCLTILSDVEQMRQLSVILKAQQENFQLDQEEMINEEPVEVPQPEPAPSKSDNASKGKAKSKSDDIESEDLFGDLNLDDLDFNLDEPVAEPVAKPEQVVEQKLEAPKVEKPEEPEEEFNGWF